MIPQVFKVGLIVCLMAMCMVGCSVAKAQELDGPVTIDMQPTSEMFDAEAAVLKALEKNKTLSNFQKLRVRVAMKYRPRVRSEILGEVTAQCIEAGYVAENGMLMAPPSGQVDWSAIIEFIEKLLPLILKLISLFAWKDSENPFEFVA